MGLGQSKTPSPLAPLSADWMVVDPSRHPEKIQFKASESYVLSYGIDNQTDPSYKHKSLSSAAGVDAIEITEMTQKTLGIHSAHCAGYVASRNPSDCTFDGMKRAFQQQAARVGLNGVLLFHFTGHGVAVGSNEVGLAPSDFNYSRERFITGKVLVEWLEDIQWQGKAMIFVLDCCYAGGIAEDITMATESEHLAIPSLFVLASCTKDETSKVIGVLGHSIFNYFFCDSLEQSHAHEGLLPIKDVFTATHKCCAAFSSLIVTADSEGSLKWGTMQPQMKYFGIQEQLRKDLLWSEEEEVDTPQPGRFQFVMQYFSSRNVAGLPIGGKDDKFIAWLETIADFNGPLAELERRGHLQGKILTSVVSLMMYSSASIFMSCKKASVDNQDLLLLAFMYIMAHIDRVKQDVEILRSDLKVAVEYYNDVLRKNKIRSREVNRLYKKIVNDLQKSSFIGEETTDSGPSTVGQSSDGAEDDDIPEPSGWSPITRVDEGSDN